MNAYDFDNTIYNGDSSIDFYLYCLLRHPKIFVRLPKQIVGAIKYLFGNCSKTEFKQDFFAFLDKLDDVDADVEGFWDRNLKKIKAFYIEKKCDTDVVISASPRFLLEPVCNFMGVRLIATEMNKKTGVISGENCSGKEKVRRFILIYSNRIDEFYSDSYSDAPMTFIAKKSFMVYGNNIKEWN